MSARALWSHTVVLLTAGVVLAACSSSTSQAPDDAARTAALAVGGAEVTPAGSALGVSLLAVAGDSRCPRSVQCVRLGDATILLGVRVGMGPTVPMQLRWGAAPSDTVVGGVRLVFDSLTPWPATPDPIAPGAYRAWISLKRIAP